MLNELTSYDQEISIPTIGSDDAELPLKLTTALASTTFSTSGASVALNPGISVVSSVLEGPGSIIRGSCGPALTPAAASETASGVLEKSQPGEMAIQEDLLNQFTFQAWSGGYFDFALDDSYIAELSDGAAEDLEGLNVQVSALAPPVLTTCTESGSPQIQLSGVHVTGSFVLNGSDASVDLYVSAFVNVDMGLVTNDKGGMNIGITQAELADIHVDVQQTTGLGELGDAIVELLLVDLVMDLFTGELVEMLAYGMPVPTVDLSNWLDTVPAGTLLTFVPYGLEMISGNVLMEGALAAP